MDRAATIKGATITKYEPQKHPLTQYLNLFAKPLRRPEFIIDGMIQAGAVAISGGWGVGKTTQLVPLFAKAAWLCHPNDPLKPTLRRRVIYITEDSGQVARIIASMAHAGEFEGIALTEVDDFLRVVDACRMPPEEIVQASTEFRSLAYTNYVDGEPYEALPLLVIDTRSAVIAVDDENSNSEASKALGTLRRGLGDIPFVIVGHMAKAVRRADISNQSSRGAGAWEADVVQVCYLTAEKDGTRWLEVGAPETKHRFLHVAQGFSFVAYKAEVDGFDEFKRHIKIPVIHGVPELVSLETKRKRAEELEQDKRVGEQTAKALERNAQIEQVVQQAWDEGEFITQNEITRQCSGRKADIIETIKYLCASNVLYRFDIPEDLRTHPKSKTSFVWLSSDEIEKLTVEKEIPSRLRNLPERFGCSKNEQQEPIPQEEDQIG